VEFASSDVKWCVRASPRHLASHCALAMFAHSSCWTTMRYVVVFVVLEVLLVLYTAKRLLVVRPGDRSGSFGLHELSDLVEMVPPRAYPPWNNLTLTLPCPPVEEGWTSYRVQRGAARTGILYVKVPKTGSSTGSSVNLRLASRIYHKVVGSASSEVGDRTQSSEPFPPNQPRVCRNRFTHAEAYIMGYGQRDRMRSVLWSVVRDPTDRVVSQYFHFFISRGGRNASDDSVFRYFLWGQRDALPSYQVRYLAFDKLDEAGNVTAEELIENHFALRRSDSLQVSSPAPPHPEVYMRTIRSILGGYDFVGVSERMDESLVALQLLLGLETSDIVYMRYETVTYEVAAWPGRTVYLSAGTTG
jgi:Sulfotransferase family